MNGALAALGYVGGLLGAWMIGGAQLAIERDHHHLRMAPVRPP